MSFLTDHEGEDIWLLLPSGLISGKVNTLPRDDFNVLILAEAMQFSGDIAVDVGTASILTDKIIAWGDSLPVFIDKEED